MIDERDSIEDQVQLSHNWLIEHGFVANDDYFRKLRMIKEALNTVMKKGEMWETTPKGECTGQKDNHHFHTYEITSDYFRGLILDLELYDPRKNNAPQLSTVNKVQEIWLGHPCGAFVIFDPTHVNGRFIQLSKVRRFDLHT